MTSQHTLFDDDSNLIQYIERNELGEVLFWEDYDSNGDVIFHMDHKSWRAVYDYHTLVYEGDMNGNWWKSIYNDSGETTYCEHSSGMWEETTYITLNKIPEKHISNIGKCHTPVVKTLYRNNAGFWRRWLYNDDGYLCRYEDSDGMWEHWDYYVDRLTSKVEFIYTNNVKGSYAYVGDRLNP